MRVPAVLITGLVGALLPMAVPVAAAAATVTGTVRTGGTAVNLRLAPSAAAGKAGTIVNGGKVAIVCQVTAQQITGTVRTTNLWDRLAGGRYVSDAYVQRPATAIPACPAVTPPAAPAPALPAPGPTLPAPVAGESWVLPVSAGLVSGFRTVARPAHDGVDLSARRGTPVLAASAGTVIRVVCNVSAGTCDVDGSPSLRGCGWYVEVQHPGAVVTRYCHLVRRPAVTVGQAVVPGQVLGHVGSSGSSSGPHLHFEVHVDAAPATHANAVDPRAFLTARGMPLG